MDERLLDAAAEDVSEGEKRRADQIRLISGLTRGSDTEVCARRVLAEIERTLTIARTHRAIMLSLMDR
ncbi:hypothetical protein [Methylobacterium durans]|uniref:Uncharacterized protein n=1 Tax=Methylobacterium durans TaxID=2202825 RepID=A0A2U8W351_9HYPH|nr:hypothetical protein [Methylobacterium durans]AWN39950.1 hypothetical protein DK389_04590 [Methylobacterium durans]